MAIVDAIPPMRLQFKGPTLKNGIVIETFANFLMKERSKFEDITPYLESALKTNTVLLYLEGAFLMHQQLPNLAEDISAKLLAEYKSLGNQNIARITQALVSSGNEIKSESLKTLLTQFFQENYQSSNFSADIKANLPRIVKLAGLDIRELKTQIEADMHNA